MLWALASLSITPEPAWLQQAMQVTMGFEHMRGPKHSRLFFFAGSQSHGSQLGSLHSTCHTLWQLLGMSSM